MRLVEAALAHPGPGLEFDVVVCDLPPNLSGWAVHPLRAAVAAGAGDTILLLVARPTVAGQAGVAQALGLLQGLGQSTPPRLVLNDYHRGLDVSPGDFVAGLRQLVACPDPIVTVPHCPAVRAAQNEGLPLALAEGTDSVVEALCNLARALGFEIRAARGEGRGAEIETRDRDRDGSRPKRRTLALPGVRFKLTD